MDTESVPSNTFNNSAMFEQYNYSHLSSSSVKGALHFLIPVNRLFRRRYPLHNLISSVSGGKRLYGGTVKCTG